MQLPLTDQQHEQLRRVRDQQLTEWRAGRPQVVDELFVTDEVVRLMSGMGRACYLGLDGRVWVGNLGEGMLPWVLDDPKEVASCIVRWSGCIGLPELANALPPALEGAVVCPLCHGSRGCRDGSMIATMAFGCTASGAAGWGGSHRLNRRPHQAAQATDGSTQRRR